MLPYPYFQQKKMLFGQPRFFSPETCQALCSEMASQPFQYATINITEGEQLANDIRKTAIVDMPQTRHQEVTSALEKLLPQFSQFHGVQLSHCQEIQFLRYRKGDFFKIHTDHYRQIPEGHQQRQLSVIIFLNAPDAYQGGEFMIYAPVSQLQQRQMGLPLKAETGLLVSFLPGVTHAVKPVTQGERYTIVAWLT